MLKLIQEIIYNVTGKSNITDDTDFVKDLELNSFDVMNIVCAFEEYFDVTIPPRDVWKMHQVKVMDLPYGKFRDKGQPIDNISNYDSTQEEIVYICDSEQMRYANLLFATKQGMVKKVGGSEFQVTKRTIAATKLQPEDEVVNIRVVTENQHIVLQTADGFFLRFPAAEVTEKKKGAIGVRGIRLKKDDALTNVYLFEEGTECKITYHEKEVTLNRLKLAKRDGTGTKYRG